MTDEQEIAAIAARISARAEGAGTAERMRLLHGRGGTFEGLSFLNIDLYPPAILVTLYEERSDFWKKSLAESLLRFPRIPTVVFQERISPPWKNSLYGDPLPDSHIISEDGLNYRVFLDKGENPGIFPDMAEGRRLVRSVARGKKVLNLFAYTCAFSVAAQAGGAASVLNMDMNRNSLSRGRDNHRLNGQDLSNIRFLDHNILKSFGKIAKEGPFDLVIVDPPPSQGTSFRLERDYGKILRKTGEFLREKGEILACLNSPRYDFPWFRNFLKENLGDFHILKELGGGDECPEAEPGSGLKIVYLKI